MKKSLPLLLLLLGLITGLMVSPARADRMTERELREFMGLYDFKVRTVVIENGVATASNGKFRDRISWKGSGGTDVVQVPGGSYAPVAEKLTMGSNWVRVRKILRGSAFNPETGEYFDIVGLTSMTLTRKGSRNFRASATSKIAYGSFLAVINRAEGKMIR